MPSDRPMPVVLLEWRRVHKNTLRGFAKVELGALILNELPVHVTQGREWVGMPSRPRIKEDGSRIMDARGRPAWDNLAQWKTKEQGDRFSASVVAAIKEQYPTALDEGE